MKILLLSDIPPCKNLTAGLVLSAMVRFLPRDSVCCFIVANPMLDIEMTQEFSNIPTCLHVKPNENWAWLPQRRLFKWASSFISYIGEQFTEKVLVRSLTNKAVNFGRNQEVDRVWAVLQGQTTIRMAKAVADGLGVPLHTHVWDPFSWWAKANCLDGVTTRHVKHRFDEAIRSSVAVATASEPMAELYRLQFGVHAVPVISSHPRSMAQVPQVEDGAGKPLLIGMAGQFYAASEWLELLRAMEAASWTVAGRPVRIVVMGPQKPLAAPESKVVFLGWKSQPDAAFILSLCDILYCPYPFDPVMKEVAQYSFPSKLVLYLAAGRPIVFHGPAYAAPARYIREKKCGLIADRLMPTAIFNEIERLCLDFVFYAQMADNAQKAFYDDFTLESMERSFNAFIGADTSSHVGDVRTYDHAACSVESFVLPQGALRESGRSFRWLGRSFAKALFNGKVYATQRFKRTVRDCALKIPRLYSLYHETRCLYAEKAALTESVQQLTDENRWLRETLKKRLGEVHVSTLENPCDRQYSRGHILAGWVSSLYPSDKVLLLMSALKNLEPPSGKVDRPTGKTDNQRIHRKTEMIWIAGIQTDAYQAIKSDDSWSAVSNILPRETIEKLVRLVLEEGIRKLVVPYEDISLIAMAITVGSLTGLQTTICSCSESDLAKIDWLGEQETVDFVVSGQEQQHSDADQPRDCSVDVIKM